MSKSVSATRAGADIPFQFSTGFLSDHVGQIIDDPGVAIVELIANCYDAGANKCSCSVARPARPGVVDY